MKNQAWRAYFRFAYIVSQFGKCVSPIRHDQQNLGRFLLRTDTRLVFGNNKLMRTDIFFTRTTKPICNFANSIVLMFNININYTTARMDYAISARPSRTPIVIRGKSRWTQKSDRGNWLSILVLIESIGILFTSISIMYTSICSRKFCIITVRS